MTEAERLADEARKADRAAVAPGSAKWNDPAYTYTEDDVKRGRLDGDEVTALMNAGRFGPAVGARRRR